MKDILPEEMQNQGLCEISVIKETYRQVLALLRLKPHVWRHIENLNSKQGGENEKLIFKVLKRGEKLKLGRQQRKKTTWLTAV